MAIALEQDWQADAAGSAEAMQALQQEQTGWSRRLIRDGIVVIKFQRSSSSATSCISLQPSTLTPLAGIVTRPGLSTG